MHACMCMYTCRYAFETVPHHVFHGLEIAHLSHEDVPIKTAFSLQTPPPCSLGKNKTVLFTVPSVEALHKMYLRETLSW